MTASTTTAIPAMRLALSKPRPILAILGDRSAPAPKAAPMQVGFAATPTFTRLGSMLLAKLHRA